jgi:hypothetical protein
MRLGRQALASCLGAPIRQVDVFRVNRPRVECIRVESGCGMAAVRLYAPGHGGFDSVLVRHLVGRDGICVAYFVDCSAGAGVVVFVQR